MLAERLRTWFGRSPEDSMLRVHPADADCFSLNSNIGLRRDENQDRTAALYVNSGGVSENSFYCFVLCDGMGGMKDGALAASLSIAHFLSH